MQEGGVTLSNAEEKGRIMSSLRDPVLLTLNPEPLAADYSHRTLAP